jgi:hypothetical protein
LFVQFILYIVLYPIREKGTPQKCFAALENVTLAALKRNKTKPIQLVEKNTVSHYDFSRDAIL